MIDNYDSFTYNLMQYVRELDVEVIVELNNKITLDEIQTMHPDGIILSPGPGTPLTPEDVGICTDIIKKLSIPTLGVCLGHQLMGHLHGGTIIRTEPKHGQPSPIHQRGLSPLFKDLPNPFEAMRYHSLIVDKDNFPEALTITAETEDGIIMAFEHKEKPLYGVQFHPESIGTPHGKTIISNFLNLCQPQ